MELPVGGMLLSAKHSKRLAAFDSLLRDEIVALIAVHLRGTSGAQHESYRQAMMRGSGQPRERSGRSSSGAVARASRRSVGAVRPADAARASSGEAPTRAARRFIRELIQTPLAKGRVV